MEFGDELEGTVSRNPEFDDATVPVVESLRKLSQMVLLPAFQEFECEPLHRVQLLANPLPLLEKSSRFTPRCRTFRLPLLRRRTLTGDLGWS